MSKTLVALCFVLTSCTLTFSPPSADVRLHFVVPTPSDSASGRALFSESSAVTVTATNPGAASTVLSFTPQVVAGVRRVDAVIKLTYGTHTITAAAVDSSGQVLSQGSGDVTIDTGANSLSLTLLPPLVLRDGASYPLAAGQIAYFQSESTTGALLRISGATSTFLTFAANQEPTGTSQAGSIDIPVGGAPLVRVVQSAAGTISAVAIPVSNVTFNFDNLTDPVVLGMNNSAWDATSVPNLLVTLSGTAFVDYDWFVDGDTGYADGAGFGLVGDALLLESAHLAPGWHEVSVVVEDAAGEFYSARFNVEVLR